MFSVAGALIIGFFVPLDVILSETYLKNKLSEIAKGIGLLRLEKTTLIFYVVILLLWYTNTISHPLGGNDYGTKEER